MDAGQAFQSLGKKATVSYATGKIGMGFNGTGEVVNGVANKGLSAAVGNSLIGKTLLKGAEMVVSNAATSAINSMDFTKIGKKDFFDTDGFKEGMIGKGAIAGYAAGMAQTLVNTGLDNATLGDKTSTIHDFSNNINDIKALNSTIAGITSTGITYGITGNASVNLLNASMFGGPDVGMLEFNFGKDGTSFNLGMGGTNLNLGKLYSSMKGIDIHYQNKRSQKYEL